MESKPNVDEIIKLICQYAKVKEEDIKTKPKGRREMNPIRAFAMYACRRYGSVSQKQLANTFQLRHPGGAAFSINKIKKEVADGKWKKAVVWIEKTLNIIKQA